MVLGGIIFLQYGKLYGHQNEAARAALLNLTRDTTLHLLNQKQRNYYLVE